MPANRLAHTSGLGSFTWASPPENSEGLMALPGLTEEDFDYLEREKQGLPEQVDALRDAMQVTEAYGSKDLPGTAG
jgi:hypothetical protein